MARSIVRRAHASGTGANRQGRVGTAYERFSQHERWCHRLCPPYQAVGADGGKI